jgi:hypothetical protein
LRDHRKSVADDPCVWTGRALQAENDDLDVKSHPTPTPRLARKNDPSDVAETGGAEPQIAEQSRSWRAAIGEREVMRGS